MIAPFWAYQALHYGCALVATSLTTFFFLIRCGQVKQRKRGVQRRFRLYSALIGLLAVSYAIDGAATALEEDAFLGSQSHLIHTFTLAFLWCIIGIRSDSSSWEIWVTSFVTAIFEVLLLVFFPFRKLEHLIPTFQLVCLAIRVFALITLFGGTGHEKFLSIRASKAETQPFLHNEEGQQSARERAYGTELLIEHPDSEEDGNDRNEESDSDSDSDADDARVKRLRAKRLEQTGSWLAYLKDFSIFLPYLIPRKDIQVQFCYLVSVICLAANRALNILVPLQLGRAADELLERKMPYESLAIWLFLGLLSEDAGLGLIQQLATIPIKQYSYRQITNAAFGHVMDMGMDFHSERDYGEVVKAVEQGEALNNVLETAVIDIAPTIVDLFIAVFLLYSKFNAYVALAMVVACIAYVSLEVKTSNWNIGNRRRRTKAQREEAKVMHQAIQGWQTVSYFNMFSHERRRFGQAVDTQLLADRDWNRRDAYIEAILELLVPTTFFCLSCLVFLEISRGQASAGSFVFLIQYWDKLIWPLKFLSGQYRWLMSDLVDAERLLELFQTRPSIVNRDTAKDLGPVKGHVAFEHVNFSYDPRKCIIEDVSFSAQPGETVALVGQTGAGKSSIVKLLFRFYDISSGQIKIDGQDIRDVTLSSLRDALGIVPQDPLLFNTSIMENLRYARFSATDDEIKNACRAAAIHDKILTFPDGYGTIVGEHGVKLSGGEVQRLAIARVFLRDPPILILDEATSAVDTATESEIQKVLLSLRKRRTTFVIAHRLSTVVSADAILVMHDGRIVERGTHQDLLQKSGRYKDLWTKQTEGVVAKKEPTIEELAKIDES